MSRNININLADGDTVRAAVTEENNQNPKFNNVVVLILYIQQTRVNIVIFY